MRGHGFTLRLSLLRCFSVAAALLSATAANAAQAVQPPSGATIYAERCATCHDAADATRAPTRESLRARSAEAIVAALSPGGVMSAQGAPLSAPEKQAVAAFLGAPAPAAGTATADASRDPGLCAATAAAFAPGTGAAWNGWGNDLSNARFQPAPAAGLSAATVPKLRLKWAFAFPGATTATTQPAVVGGRVFVGSEAGGVWSLDLASGCTYWKFDTEGGVRSAITVERVSQSPARYAAFFGDFKANVYAVDAVTGQLIWKAKADQHPFARITGAPSFHNNRLFVTVSSIEEVPASRPNYPCCTFRGSVLALDAATGKEMWHTYMIPDAPQIVGKNPSGTPLWKTAGAAIWSAPTIDASSNAVYVATGNAYTEPAAPLSDAIVALDINSGAIRWSNQITPKDAYLVGCKPDNPNCPTELGPDHDFGSSPILRSVNGKRVLLAGQKSGVLFALDPDGNGKLLWQQRVGKGSELGGIEWGPAADTANVYVAVSDVIAQGTGPSEQAGGLHALKIATGERVWYAAPPALTCKGGPACSSAQSAAVSVIPGVVFSGSIDGHLRAYSTADGKIIWDYDTAKEYETVNGVKGAGGSIDGAGPVIVNGMVLTNSGYGRWRGKPGNVLLAFGIQ